MSWPICEFPGCTSNHVDGTFCKRHRHLNHPRYVAATNRFPVGTSVEPFRGGMRGVVVALLPLKPSAPVRVKWANGTQHDYSCMSIKRVDN